ncbi:MAG: alpha/beta hydrolase [Thermoleophilaceae bacterium]
MPREDLTFESHGERCAAWHYPGEGDAFAGERGRPCVVMAHGFGFTRDSGLEPFAEDFAAAGLDVLLFDYRNFGDSTGEPRQLIDWRRHRQDWRLAVGFARLLDGVDPDRIALWGTSYSGGHVIAVAADDGRVAGVISQSPAVDGLAALLAIGRYAGWPMLARFTLEGIKDAVGGARGREPHRIPIVGEPGELAALMSPDAMPGLKALAGPTLRNEYCARAGLFAVGNRPITRAGDLPCPILFQIADRDVIAPAAPIEKAAWNAPGRAEVRRYPMDHFDVYLDGRERLVADQLHFLRRHLALAPAREAQAQSA